MNAIAASVALAVFVCAARSADAGNRPRATLRLGPPLCPVASPEPDRLDRPAIELGSDMSPDQKPSAAPWLITGAGLVATSALVAMAARTSAWTCNGDQRKVDCIDGQPPPWTTQAREAATIGAVLGGGALVIGGLLLVRPQPRTVGGTWHIAPMVTGRWTGVALSTSL